jgi:hypothetical protein
MGWRRTQDFAVFGSGVGARATGSAMKVPVCTAKRFERAVASVMWSRTVKLAVGRQFRATGLACIRDAAFTTIM